MHHSSKKPRARKHVSSYVCMHGLDIPLLKAFAEVVNDGDIKVVNSVMIVK